MSVLTPFHHWAEAFARAREQPTVAVAEPPTPDEPDDDWGSWFGLGHMTVQGRGEVMIVYAGPHQQRRKFEVWVSEKGRSVRLWVDNEEIPLPRRENAH